VVLNDRFPIHIEFLFFGFRFTSAAPFTFASPSSRSDFPLTAIPSSTTSALFAFFRAARASAFDNGSGAARSTSSSSSASASGRRFFVGSSGEER